MEKIGIIVGNGKLPLYFLKESINENIELYPVGLFSSIEPEIKAHKNYKEFNIGNVGEITKYFLKNNILKVIMLGKVEKKLIFENLELDEIGTKLLKKLPDRKDETLLFGTIVFFKLNGIKILPQNYLLKTLMVEKKCYTTSTPTPEEKETIKIGLEAGIALGKLDIGQSIICKDSSIVAIEGIEGTDATILRGGLLSGRDTILIKMGRAQQDMRVDIPTVGINTIKKLVEIGARGIVMDSKKMLFLDQKECIELADKNKIFMIGR